MPLECASSDKKMEIKSQGCGMKEKFFKFLNFYLRTNNEVSNLNVFMASQTTEIYQLKKADLFQSLSRLHTLHDSKKHRKHTKIDFLLKIHGKIISSQQTWMHFSNVFRIEIIEKVKIYKSNLMWMFPFTLKSFDIKTDK